LAERYKEIVQKVQKAKLQAPQSSQEGTVKLDAAGEIKINVAYSSVFTF